MASQPTLSADRVNAVFMDCLFREDEVTDAAVLAEGVVCNVGFHPGRVAENADAIGEMLRDLPDEFMQTKGGGWSFLNACMDRHGTHWGEHRSIEQLFQLGIATKQASWLLPREMWSVMPGGMPYAVVQA